MYHVDGQDGYHVMEVLKKDILFVAAWKRRIRMQNAYAYLLSINNLDYIAGNDFRTLIRNQFLKAEGIRFSKIYRPRKWPVGYTKAVKSARFQSVSNHLTSLKIHDWCPVAGQVSGVFPLETYTSYLNCEYIFHAGTESKTIQKPENRCFKAIVTTCAPADETEVIDVIEANDAIDARKNRQNRQNRQAYLEKQVVHPRKSRAQDDVDPVKTVTPQIKNEGGKSPAHPAEELDKVHDAPAMPLMPTLQGASLAQAYFIPVPGVNEQRNTPPKIGKKIPPAPIVKDERQNQTVRSVPEPKTQFQAGTAVDQVYESKVSEVMLKQDEAVQKPISGWKQRPPVEANKPVFKTPQPTALQPNNAVGLASEVSLARSGSNTGLLRRASSYVSGNAGVTTRTGNETRGDFFLDAKIFWLYLTSAVSGHMVMFTLLWMMHGGSPLALPSGSAFIQMAGLVTIITAIYLLIPALVLAQILWRFNISRGYADIIIGVVIGLFFGKYLFSVITFKVSGYDLRLLATGVENMLPFVIGGVVASLLFWQLSPQRESV